MVCPITYGDHNNREVVVCAGFTESAAAHLRVFIAGGGGANKISAASEATGGVTETFNHYPVLTRHDKIV